MNETELVKVMKRLPDRYADRVPSHDLDGLRSMAGGGEWDEEIDLLVAALRGTQASVSAAERDQLHELLVSMGRPTDVLDGLNVTP